MLFRALKLMGVAAAAIFAGHAMKRAAEGKKRLVSGAARDTAKSFDIAGMIDVENKPSRPKAAAPGKAADEITKGRRALARLVRTGEPQINAMRVPGLGPVDFLPGHFDKRKGVGAGLKKIKGAMRAKSAYYHNPAFSIAILKHVPEILMKGERQAGEKGRIVFRHEGRAVILQKPGNTWLLNAFPEVPGQTLPTKEVIRRLRKQKKKRIP